MYKYLQEYERWIVNVLEADKSQDWCAIRDRHMAQIYFFQHERLVHLIITLAFVVFMLTSVIVTALYTVWPMLLLDVILTVMVGFYIIHYYRLENGVQRWYRIYEQICTKIEN